MKIDERKAERLEIFLDELSEYLSDRADADHDGERYIGNKEMRLLCDLRELRGQS
jgi:hypothetical protein